MLELKQAFHSSLAFLVSSSRWFLRGKTLRALLKAACWSPVWDTQTISRTSRTRSRETSTNRFFGVVPLELVPLVLEQSSEVAEVLIVST